MLDFDPDWEQRVRQDQVLGYPYFVDRTHPLASKRGKVYVHRHVASVTLGRWLRGDEHVHHINHDRTDNRPENLSVTTHSEHARQHALEQARARGQKPKVTRPCETCTALTTNRRFCSPECTYLDQRRATRPGKAQLEKLLSENTYVAVGKMFGVSDNTIRKWKRAYEKSS